LVSWNGCPKETKPVGREWSNCSYVHDPLEGFPCCGVLQMC
jgi:hypothetical protein